MQLITLIIVVVTYAAVAIGSVPRLRMNRATIALVGAAALVAVGAITQDQAFAAIDLGTLVLLGAMMVINVNLRLAGFFNLVTARVLQAGAHAARPAGADHRGGGRALSNLPQRHDLRDDDAAGGRSDAAPQAQPHPLPDRLGDGDQRRLDGDHHRQSAEHHHRAGEQNPLRDLSAAPRAGGAARLARLLGRDRAVVPRRVSRHARRRSSCRRIRTYPPLLNRSLLVVAGLMIAFLAGFPVASAAAVAAGLLLISRLRAAKLLGIDWGLLAFFTGLFVVTGAIEVSGLSGEPLRGGCARAARRSGVVQRRDGAAQQRRLQRPGGAAAALGSRRHAQPQLGWLTLAMASTLAGNLTLLGSAANLIVAELAAQARCRTRLHDLSARGRADYAADDSLGVVWLSLVGT